MGNYNKMRIAEIQRSLVPKDLRGKNKNCGECPRNLTDECYLFGKEFRHLLNELEVKKKKREISSMESFLRFTMGHLEGLRKCLDKPANPPS